MPSPSPPGSGSSSRPLPAEGLLADPGAEPVPVFGARRLQVAAVEAVLGGHPPAARRERAVAVLVDPVEEHWARARGLGATVVLVTTALLDADGILAAVLRGADAVVWANADGQELAEAVDVVGGGGTLLSPTLMRLLADALRAQSGEGDAALNLTEREGDILRSIDRGDTVKQTANALGISAKTVEHHQSRLFRKLGVRNRAQAVAMAHALGIIREQVSVTARPGGNGGWGSVDKGPALERDAGKAEVGGE